MIFILLEKSFWSTWKVWNVKISSADNKIKLCGCFVSCDCSLCFGENLSLWIYILYSIISTSWPFVMAWALLFRPPENCFRVVASEKTFCELHYITWWYSYDVMAHKPDLPRNQRAILSGHFSHLGSEWRQALPFGYKSYFYTTIFSVRDQSLRNKQLAVFMEIKLKWNKNIVNLFK